MSDDLLWNLLAAETGHVGEPPPVAPARRGLSWHPLQLAAMVVFGVCVDAMLRTDRLGVGTSIALSMAGVGVLVRRGSRSGTRLVLVTSGVALAWCLTLRSSAWLGVPTLLGACGLLALAVNPDVTLTTDRLRDVISASLRVFAGPGALWADVSGRVRPSVGVLRRHSRWTKATLRGVALAVPVTVLLGGLLASGDQVFARSFSFELPGLGPAASHVVFFLLGVVILAAVFAASATASTRSTATGRADDRSRIGLIEAVVVLGSVSALYLAFAVAQVLAIVGGDEHVRRTTGLTYAEYARSGFFQLLAVSVLTLIVLGVTRYGVGTALRQRRGIVLASEAVVLLTLGIVAVAFRRMSLYENAYGLTMRRLLPHIVIVVLGIVFVMLAIAYANDLRTARPASVSASAPWSGSASASNSGTQSSARTWVIPTALAVIVVALLGMNLVNLEAMVARSQLERSLDGETSATAEVLGLGSDAVPTVVAWLNAHPFTRPSDAASLFDAVQRWACPERSTNPTWAGYSFSWQRAVAARRACAPT